MKIEPYYHMVQYYETDKMGITHHANYIHWLQEARIDLMQQIGYPYDRLESEGVGVPIVGISFDYKASTTFPDKVQVVPHITSFNGVILQVSYELYRTADQKLVGTGTSRHAFVGKDGRLLRLKRDHSEFYNLMLSLVETPEETKA